MPISIGRTIQQASKPTRNRSQPSALNMERYFPNGTTPSHRICETIFAWTLSLRCWTISKFRSVLIFEHAYVTVSRGSVLITRTATLRSFICPSLKQSGRARSVVRKLLCFINCHDRKRVELLEVCSVEAQTSLP